MKGTTTARSSQIEEANNIITNNNMMFARLHHHHLGRDQRQPSEEEESRSSTAGIGAAASVGAEGSAGSVAKKTKKTSDIAGGGGGGGGGGGAGAGGDGATIEVVRRPRGRPPGSKNKPKPPFNLTSREAECSMRPVVLEIPGGVDVVDAISRFSRRRNIGLCVLTGSGTVTNVSLRQPSSASSGVIVTFHGRFDILSISATFLPSSSLPSAITNSFTISLAGPQGQIVGGAVAGSLLAAGTVFVVAASFATPSYHRLPEQEDHHGSRMEVTSGASVSVSVSAGCDEAHHGGPTSESCGMPIYSCHNIPNSDVIWASTSRPPF